MRSNGRMSFDTNADYDLTICALNDLCRGTEEQKYWNFSSIFRLKFVDFIELSVKIGFIPAGQVHRFVRLSRLVRLINSWCPFLSQTIDLDGECFCWKAQLCLKFQLFFFSTFPADGRAAWWAFSSWTTSSRLATVYRLWDCIGLSVLPLVFYQLPTSLDWNLSSLFVWCTFNCLHLFFSPSSLSFKFIWPTSVQWTLSIWSHLISCDFIWFHLFCL